MRIAVLSPLDPVSAEAFVHGGVRHRPALLALAPAAAARELQRLRPAVMIARDAQAEALQALVDALPQAQRPLLILLALAGAPVPIARPSCHRVTASSWVEAEHEAFALAERLCRPRPAALARGNGDEVLLVGAGVVNLITALRLVEDGRRVTLIDRMSDPLASDAAPVHAGASFGGGDARIFSLNESRHHLTETAAAQFARDVDEEGWLARASDAMDEAGRRWMAELHALPRWAALQYGNDIVRFNQESEAAWPRVFSLYPELLLDAHHVGRLLRVYPSDAALACAMQAESEIGALLGSLDTQALSAQEPALAGAVARGAIAGALRVRGFSINVHRFARNIVRLLQREGARFLWEHALEEVQHDARGRVCRLVVNGRALEAANVVLSPGAYGHAIVGRLPGLRSIGAMVGAWTSVPNDVQPLATPLKVRRRGFGSAQAAQGANVIPARDAAGRPVLHISSGHGFLGVDARQVGASELDALARCVRETAEDLFPERRPLSRTPAFCVRPWTPSGLGLLEIQPTAAGGLLVLAGGHNTGGFAQSPAVAEAVACALDGCAHAMHTLYHPQRFAQTFGEAA